MTFLQMSQSHHRVLIAAGVLGLTLLAAPAQAFTIDDQSAAASANAARLADPAARLSGTGNSDDKTVIRNGNMTLQLGSSGRSSFDSRYNTERMFNPNGRPGE